MPRGHTTIARLKGVIVGGPCIKMASDIMITSMRIGLPIKFRPQDLETISYTVTGCPQKTRVLKNIIDDFAHNITTEVF